MENKIFFIFSNNGQEIVNTNYWDSQHAKKGYLYLSWNARAARLLVPNSQTSLIAEVKTAKYVIITRGKYQRRDAVELLFEDHSDSPYSIHIVAEQCDRMLSNSEEGSKFVLAIWTKNGKQLQLPAKYRVVKKLPDLSPWE